MRHIIVVELGVVDEVLAMRQNTKSHLRDPQCRFAEYEKRPHKNKTYITFNNNQSNFQRHWENSLNYYIHAEKK